MSRPVSLSSIHTRILLRNITGLMTVFSPAPFSQLPPLCSDSHWSSSQAQPYWSVSARSHDRRVQAPGVTVWPEGQWRCGGYLSGIDSPIFPSCWTMPVPSLRLSYSLYLSLVRLFQSQQKCRRLNRAVLFESSLTMRKMMSVETIIYTTTYLIRFVFYY